MIERVCPYLFSLEVMSSPPFFFISVGKHGWADTRNKSKSNVSAKPCLHCGHIKLSAHVAAALSCWAGRWCRWEAGRWGWGWSWRTAPADSSWPADSPRSETLGGWPTWSCAERAPWRLDFDLLDQELRERSKVSSLFSSLVSGEEKEHSAVNFNLFCIHTFKWPRRTHTHTQLLQLLSPGWGMWPFLCCSTWCDDITVQLGGASWGRRCVKLDSGLSGINTNVSIPKVE